MQSVQAMEPPQRGVALLHSLLRIIAGLWLLLVMLMMIAVGGGALLRSPVLSFNSADYLQGPRSDVYLLDSRTQVFLNITAHLPRVLLHEWAPDGRRLGLTVAAGLQSGLVIIDSQWQAEQVILAEMGWFTWSPDGKRIAYNAPPFRNKNDMEIFIADVTAQAEPSNHTNTVFTNEFRPLWSADGRWILYDTSNPFGLFAFAVGHSAGPVALQTGENPITAAWSPDGVRVVSLAHTGTQSQLTIFNMRVDGRIEQRFTFAEAGLHSPRWSPDGAQIALLDDSSKPFVFSLSDHRLQALMPTAFEVEANLRPLQWSADSRWLATIRSADHQVAILIIDVAAQSVRRIPAVPQIHAESNLRWWPDPRRRP